MFALHHDSAGLLDMMTVALNVHLTGRAYLARLLWCTGGNQTENRTRAPPQFIFLQHLQSLVLI